MDLSETPRGRFQRHPWELARAAFFLDELVSSCRSDQRARILDVGAGDAWLARQVSERLPESTITCWDSGYATAARAPDGRIRYTTDPGDGPFDLCLVLDVAEHVEDDTAFLREVVAKLVPGGTLIFSVPAWPLLYSHHDRALRHFRRYRPADARALLEASGLQVLRSGGLFHSLLLPRAAQVALERHRSEHRESSDRPEAAPSSLVWKGSQGTRSLVLAALNLDLATSRLVARLGLEVPGLTWWATCRRASS